MVAVALIVDDVLACAAAGSPSHPAVTLGDASLTFGELRRSANRLANALVGLGVAPGDRVCWWSEIDLAGVALYFGLNRLGAAFAPLNPAYADAELAPILEYLRPRLLVVDPAHAEAASVLAGTLGVELAVLGGGAPGGDVPAGAPGRVPGADLGALARASSPADPDVPLPGEDDVATIFLTSGSTGRPKGVMVSQRASWLRTHAGAAAHATSGGRGEVVMFPLFHMAGWNFAGMAWSAHHTAHLVRRAEADELLGAVRRFGAETLYCIPAVWRRILEAPAVEVPSLRWALTGTSQVSSELLHELKGRFPAARTTVNYGSTETARAVALGDEDLFARPGSVGKPIPGVRGRIADDGELLLRTDRVMTGYFDLPDETAEALAGGWYHTGDLAEQDGDGYLYVVGRKKEVVRTGGETVSPAEVEAALAGFPGLAEVAVVGLPDEHWGEIVCAVVVMEDGVAVPEASALRAHIGGRLAPFKHPRRVEAVDRLPRTSATGQVQRAALAQRLGG
ncbi:MAG: class I adenylate-forming enzyme family protein [Acidimicrobiales bacterium]